MPWKAECLRRRGGAGPRCPGQAVERIRGIGTGAGFIGRQRIETRDAR
jgi:hypothetical protein